MCEPFSFIGLKSPEPLNLVVIQPDTGQLFAMMELTPFSGGYCKAKLSFAYEWFSSCPPNQSTTKLTLQITLEVPKEIWLTITFQNQTLYNGPVRTPSDTITIELDDIVPNPTPNPITLGEFNLDAQQRGSGTGESTGQLDKFTFIEVDGTIIP